ncbi:MAG: phenylalanine--tRNA ligase subunit beta [Deltaproteobacteria bacterium]|jgi:phenylalanyl-tRNA synthetase beta chain|nr:phenylalanine--tRNA ligase subunit beta [Deltaproteobacteria bacterium]
MLVSYRWLQELCPVEADVAEVARRLSLAGLEVEALEEKGRDLESVVIAEVRAKSPHPKHDKLTLVRVFDGEDELDVVCGASNVPEPGGRVLFARPGAALPNGMEIAPRKVGGVESNGMICSEAELDIGSHADGIFVVESEHAALPGTPVTKALDLHDFILDIGLTPNRPDCLGHVGIAREIGVLFGTAYRPRKAAGPCRVFAPGPIFEASQPTTGLVTLWDGEAGVVDAPTLPEIAVEIEDGDRCPRYGAALVSGVQVAPSPFWLRYRLHNLGLRALSNVVDATNLILLEWGHPIHGFDLSRLRGSKVVVRLAKEGERMATLDGVERTFTADDLLICDGEGPVAVAGVMGGLDSEIRDETKDVLIECAYFDPRSIRRTSRRLGLHTDSSHRFERGVDPEAVPHVLASAASLIAELGGGAVATAAIDRIAKPYEARTIRLRPQRAAQLLGAPVSAEQSLHILDSLGCRIVGEDDVEIRAAVPSWRPDLQREVDLIEEVARVRGYDQIPTAVPRVHPSETGTPGLLKTVDALRDAAVAVGLYEAINYGFVSIDDLRKARVSTAAVALANPLSEERAVMRTSLLPGLTGAAARAQRHGASEVRLFEIARTFEPSDAVLPRESSTLAIALAGQSGGWIGGAAPFDFYDGKGVVEAILDAVFGRVPDFVSGQLPAFMHPKRSAAVTLESRPVGFVGEIHPDVGDDLALIGRVVYAELDVAALYALAEELGPTQARGLPKFPAVTRDIAMLVRDEFSAGDIADALADASGGLAESVVLFDLYRGGQIPVGHRSLAFRVTYRDPEATLTDKRVDKVHASLAEIASDRFDATIR